MNSQKRRVESPSCLLRLSLLQAQVEKVEKLLYCIKDTLNFKEACPVHRDFRTARFTS